jgi:hypothetical protein
MARPAPRIWPPDDVGLGSVVLPAARTRSWNAVTNDVRDGDPRSTAVRVRAGSVLRRDEQSSFRIVIVGQMTCDASAFFVAGEVRGTEGDDGSRRTVFAKTPRQGAPRDVV